MSQRTNRAKYSADGVHCAAVNCGSPRVGFEVTLGTDALEKLRWKGGDQVSIYFGAAGAMLIRRNGVSGTYRLLQNGHKLRVRTTAYPAEAKFKTPKRKEPVYYQVSEGVLEIEYPDWYFEA